MRKVIMLLLLSVVSCGVFAQACQVQTIVTPTGIVSCYTCPNMPPYCTGI